MHKLYLHVSNSSKRKQVPADMVLLRTTEKSGASFIRTDQLDGETDWKLRFVCAFTSLRDNNQLVCFVRRAVSVMQKLPSDASVFSVWASVYGKIMCVSGQNA